MPWKHLHTKFSTEGSLNTSEGLCKTVISIGCNVLVVFICWCFAQRRIEQWLPMSGELVQENYQGQAAVREARDQEGNSVGNVQGIWKNKPQTKQNHEWFFLSNGTLKNTFFFPLNSTTSLSAAFWMRRWPLPLQPCTGEFRPCAGSNITLGMCYIFCNISKFQLKTIIRNYKSFVCYQSLM